jgi:antitoxin YefM
MIKAAKQKGIVGKQGKIEIRTPELPEGTEVEIIVLVPSSEEDATEYLLSTDANRRELLEAIERVNNQDNIVIMSSEEWHEKYCL